MAQTDPKTGSSLSGRSRFDGRRNASTFAGFGWFHLQGIIEAVEVIEEAYGAKQFHHFAFGEKVAQLGKLLVGDGMGVPGDGLGQPEGGLFSGREIVALWPLGEVGELVVAPAESTSKDGVAGQAVGG